MRLMPWKKKNNAVARRGEGACALGLFRSEMNRVMDRFFMNPWALFDEDPFLPTSGWAPSFDVVDGEKEVTVRAEIPGIDPKEV
jgi:HSP20 family molecular chaperone IbpA